MARDYDTSCSICKHAVDHDWFGLPVGSSHCPRIKPDGTRCHATWDNENHVHCVGCHRTFSRHSSLEKHKGRGGQCFDPALRKTKSGRPYFGEPTMNKYGTIIWRQAGTDAPWRSVSDSS